MAMSNTSYLEKHGDKWRVTVKIPLKAQPIFGKTFLKQPLGTSSLQTANLLKVDVVARFKRQIEEAMREVAPDDHHSEAMAIRARLELLPRSVDVLVYDHGYEQEVDAVDDDAATIETIAEEIEKKHGLAEARSFVKIASGKGLLIKQHLKAFRDDHGYQPKSILDLDRSISRLVDWLKANNLPTLVQTVTPELATAYFRHLINEELLSHKSVGKYASFLRSYWLWLAEQNYIAPNLARTWNLPIPKRKSAGRHTEEEPDSGKRPYTDEELTTLLTGLEGPIHHLALIGALSGMRIEELYRLKCRDIENGFFVVRTGKTKNATRRVPVHSGLVSLIESLTEGREGSTYLLDPTAPVVPLTGLRSGAASKAFSRQRVKLGVDDKPNGKSKSNIDFHSLRRWFIMKARDALATGATGFTMWTLADVVGHGDGLTDTLKMTMGLYPGPSADAALRACVEAVELPDGI